MEREIKFRAWDKLKREWLFGYELPNLGGFSLIGEVVLFGELSKFSLDYYQNIIFMQYTGLKDKNGTEIYEGDIVRYGEDVLTVTWNKKFASFCLDKSGWMHSHYFGEAASPSKCEVIGNIHLNPELLTNN